MLSWFLEVERSSEVYLGTVGVNWATNWLIKGGRCRSSPGVLPGGHNSTTNRTFKYSLFAMVKYSLNRTDRHTVNQTRSVKGITHLLGLQMLLQHLLHRALEEVLLFGPSMPQSILKITP